MDWMAIASLIRDQSGLRGEGHTLASQMASSWGDGTWGVSTIDVQGDENATDRVVGVGAAMGRCSVVIVDGGSQWGFDLGNSEFLPVEEGLGGGSVSVTTVHVVEVTLGGQGRAQHLG